MREESRLPVVIVAGLHADARQHVVDRLLRAVPGSVALLHDLATAAEGTVRRILRDASGVLASGETPLVNDCACCALREDLVPELERLAGHGLTRLAIVELWDSVEPKAMAEVVAAHSGDDLTLTNVITAVDPALVLPYLSNGDDLAEAGLAAAATDQRTVGDTWARQLEYAPVLALVDSEDADEHDHALLTQLHPTARHVDALSGELAHLAFTGFDVEAAAAAQHPACALLPQEADEAGVTTLVWHRTRPFPPNASTRRWRTCAAPPPAAGAASGSPTALTPCSPGTRPAAPCASKARARGSPPCPTPPGSWSPRYGERPPHWTGIPNTATAASISSSPHPDSTAPASSSSSTPACSPTPNTRPDPRGGSVCRRPSTPCSTPRDPPPPPPVTRHNPTRGIRMTRRVSTRKPVKPRTNPLVAAGITYIDYKDTDLLRRFISDRGKIRSRRVTHVTAQQQRQLAAAIKNAREMALLPYSSK
ncbi:hypothetical protein SALBM311S_02862 [Streptomyces alboniger]